MNKEKWIVFKEYLLWPVVGCVAVLAFLIGYYIFTNITSRELVLRGLLANVKCSLENFDAMPLDIADYYDINTKDEVVDISYAQDERMLISLQSVGGVDFFFMDKTKFEELNKLEYDILEELDDIIDETIGLENIQGKLTVYRNRAGKIAGFSVKNNTWLEKYEIETSDDVIFAISNSGNNKEFAIKFMKLLLENK